MLFVGLLGCSLVYAEPRQGPQPLKLSLNFSSNYTDNALKTSVDKQSDNSGSVTLSFDSPWRYEGKRWSVNANYSLGRTQYQDNDSQNTSTIVGSGTFNWQPTHYFNVRLSDREQTVLIDAFSPDVESNRTRQSVYSIVPGLTFKLDDLSNIVLSSQLEVTDPHNADTDNERIVNSMQLNRRISNLLTANLSISDSDIDFKHGDGDYKSQNWNLSLVKQLRAGQLSMAMGRNSNKPDAGDRSDGTNWSLGYTGRISKNQFSLSVARNFSDNGLSQLPSAIRSADTRELRKNTTANATLARSFGSTSFTWQLSHNTSEVSNLSRERAMSSSIQLAKTLSDIAFFESPRITFSQSLTKRAEALSDENDIRRVYSAAMTSSILKNLRVNMRFEHTNRSGVSRSTYEENRVILGGSLAIF